jgi:hypothetical protein
MLTCSKNYGKLRVNLIHDRKKFEDIGKLYFCLLESIF